MRRKLLLFCGFGSAVSCAIAARRLIGIMFSEWIYQKDFIQFYLMGRALREGVDLYTPLKSLAAQFDPNLGHWLQHPSAYPPIVALIGLPLSYLPYSWAVVVWLLFELACLALAIYLLVRRFGGRNAATPVLIVIMAFVGWRPLYLDLYLGQLMVPILLLLTCAWLLLRERKDVKAGLLLGIVLAIKLYAWPLVLFLFLKRDYRRSAIIAGCVLVAANLLMLGIVGPQVVTNYYLHVGNNVAAEYRLNPFNFSVFAIGYRAFGTMGGLVMALIVLALSLLTALRAKEFDASYMVMLCASAILQPVSWVHYFIPMLPAFCFVANRKDLTLRHLIAAVALVILVVPVFHHLASQFAPAATWPPVLFTLGLMWIVVPNQTKTESIRRLAVEAG